MPFKKGHDPNRNYGGRPKGSTKKLTKSEMETLNTLLGKVTGEAVELIVEIMRNDQLGVKDRMAAAKTVLTTKIQTDQIVERRKSGEDDDDDFGEEKSTVINLAWNNDFSKDKDDK